MKDMLKLGFILALFASVACVCLAVVNIFTAPTIAAVQEAKANAGMKVVFADAQSFEQAELKEKSSGGMRIDNLYLAKQKDEIIGAVISITGPTYDEATMLIGLDLNHTITGIEFLSLGDTPGYGQAATEPEFTNQFVGLVVPDKLVAGTDFDGISGSTITTVGVTSIINYATAVMRGYLAGNYEGEQEDSQETYMQAFFATAEAFDKAELTRVTFDDIIINNLYLAKQGNMILGAVVEVTGPTYSEATMLIGLDLNRTITGIAFLELGDTPGLGQTAAEPAFTDQFIGLDVSTPLVAGTDFDGISGSTITTDGVTSIVNYTAEVIGGYLAANWGGKEEQSNE